MVAGTIMKDLSMGPLEHQNTWVGLAVLLGNRTRSYSLKLTGMGGSHQALGVAYFL